MKIEIPKLYWEAMTSESPLVCIEHADLPRTRLESIAVHLLPDVIITPSIQRERFTLSRIPNLKKGPKAGSCCSYEFGNRVVWLVDARRLDCSELPFSAVDFSVVLSAESLDEETIRHFERCSKRLLCIGKPGRAGSSWYNRARRGELHKFTADQIIGRYPDQSEYRRTADDLDYARMMDLEEESLGDRAPFRVFARRRLRVRTDKTAAFLTPKQQAEAATQHGTPVVTFEASHLQKKYLAKKRLAVMQGKKPWYLLLKYRRGGFTTIEQGLNYETAVTVPRSQVACLAHTRDNTSRIFRIAKLYQELDPSGLPLVGDSKSHLEFTNGSFYYIGTAGSSGFARGDTLQRVHGSEVSKWCHADQEQVQELMAGIMGACEHGEIVLETTPNGIEWFATKYREAKQGLNDFTPIFLRWFDDPANRLLSFDAEEIMDTLDAKEQFLINEYGLDLAQIAFRRDRKRNFGVLFPQEYPEDDETCFLVSGTPYFDIEFLLSYLETMTIEPKSVRSLPGGREVRWEDPIPGVKYVLGADTSEGLQGCDPNGLGVLRKDTGAQVCSLHGLFDPRSLADHICRIGTEYNKALIGVERENHGHAVLQRVMDNGIRTSHFDGGMLYFHGKRGRNLDKSRAGWSTNAATRPVMLDQLSEWLTAPDPEGRLRDRAFLSECTTFRLQSNGKFAADPGCHDDSVMKWAVAVQMLNVRQPKPEIILI